jgi:hypothetical protein
VAPHEIILEGRQREFLRLLPQPVCGNRRQGDDGGGENRALSMLITLTLGGCDWSALRSSRFNLEGTAIDIVRSIMRLGWHQSRCAHNSDKDKIRPHAWKK